MTEISQQRVLRTEIPGPRSLELHARKTAAVAPGIGTTLPVYIERAGGGILVDADGNQLIDFGSGIAVVSVGNAAPRVVAAVQELPDDADVLADAAACAGVLDGAVMVLHGTPVSFAERSVGLDSALTSGLDTLDAGVRFLADHRFGVRATSRLVRAHPHELVNDRLEANLLIVGGSRVGGIPGLGRVARSAVRHAPCPVVITPRH